MFQFYFESAVVKLASCEFFPFQGCLTDFERRVLRPNECSSQNVSWLPFLSQNKCVYRQKIKTVDIFWSKTEQLNDNPFRSLYSDLQDRLTNERQFL